MRERVERLLNENDADRNIINWRYFLDAFSMQQDGKIADVDFELEYLNWKTKNPSPLDKSRKKLPLLKRLNTVLQQFEKKNKIRDFKCRGRRGRKWDSHIDKNYAQKQLKHWVSRISNCSKSIS